MSRPAGQSSAQCGTARRWRIVAISSVILGVLLTGCHGDSAAPVIPARAEVVSSTPAVGTVGAALPSSPTFSVFDAQGRIAAGVPVTVQVTEGGGSILNAPTRTSSSGLTSVGIWTLGTRAGRNALTVTVGSLPPLVIEATGVPGPATRLVVLTGNAQTAFAGEALPTDLAVLALDQFDNGVSGVPVVFTVVSGGGSLSTASGTTSDAGVVSGVQWRLGREGGAQHVTAVATVGATQLSVDVSATIRSDYDVSLRFFGPPPAAAIAATFTAAADRIHAVVVGDVLNVPLSDFDASRCGVPGVTLNEIVDDVVIYATVTPIDGPGKVLGSAGPCLVRSGTDQALLGVMRFDVADLNVLATSSRLGAVILHEMLHVVGIGTIWRTRGLLSGSGTADPRFLGPVATSRCNAQGGVALCGTSVPVENTGGPGTREGHWRETTFDSELMTGFIEGPGIPDPLSAITVGSLEDVGYTVNYLAADPYVISSTATRLRAWTEQDTTPWEVVGQAPLEVAPGGWVRGRRATGSRDGVRDPSR